MYKKRNVAYVKPQEPNFLTKLKKEAGYVAGPDVDTKREQLPIDSDSDSEKPDENPVVVVLNPGDLTAEEAAKIEADKKLEKANAKADLTERVIFQKPISSKRRTESDTEGKEQEKVQRKKKKKSEKGKISQQLLSFDQEEENEC